MSWYIHHVNLEAHDVAQTASFFRDIIGLKEGQWTYPEIIGKIGHSDDTLAYFGTENQGFLMQKDILKIFPENKQTIKSIGNHFKNQSIYGGLILLGFIFAS